MQQPLHLQQPSEDDNLLLLSILLEVINFAINSLSHILCNTLLKILNNYTLPGEALESFKSRMVDANVDNITSAWKWFTERECGGARKYLPALRFVLENIEEKKLNIGELLFRFLALDFWCA